MRGKVGSLFRVGMAEFVASGQDHAAQGLADIGVQLVEALTELDIRRTAANQGAEQAFVALE